MKLIIIDRDGVINHERSDYIKTPEEWIPVAGSLPALAKLHYHDWKIAVASNQSAVGRKIISLDDLARIQQKMNNALGLLGAHIDGFFFCPHAPQAQCKCRKPQPGLLKEISERFGTPLNQVPFIGDTMKDILAAKQVGAKPILVRTGKGRQTLSELSELNELNQNEQPAVYKDLAQAVDDLLAAS